MLLSVVVAASATSHLADIVTSHEITVDRHISEIMPLFVRLCLHLHLASACRVLPGLYATHGVPHTFQLVFSLRVCLISMLVWQMSDELNAEWNTRLTSQRLLNTRELGQLVHQEYALPWPLAPRDLLMKVPPSPCTPQAPQACRTLRCTPSQDALTFRIIAFAVPPWVGSPDANGHLRVLFGHAPVRSDHRSYRPTLHLEDPMGGGSRATRPHAPQPATCASCQRCRGGA